MLVRLQKCLADAGVASRRASEELIVAGRVAVNGEGVRELGVKVDPARDAVTVDGQLIRARRKLYVALNKPAGYVCTRQDPQGRRVVTDLLPHAWGHLYTVGRLDRSSEGLLLLTNDGEFCLLMTHPRYGVLKTYVARVEGRAEPAALKRLAEGVVDRGERLRARRARLVSANRTHSVIEVELAEGKNREVRRLLAAQGLVVDNLQRTRIGPIKLGELPVGKWRVLTPREVCALRRNVTVPPLEQGGADRSVN
jgi:23S rRNA pseudouridine2605 synthase